VSAVSRCRCFSHDGFQLSPEGLAQREFVLPGVDAMAIRPYVDKVGSVSALVEVEDDFDYDELHVELNQGFIHHGT